MVGLIISVIIGFIGIFILGAVIYKEVSKFNEKLGLALGIVTWIVCLTVVVLTILNNL